MARGYAGAMMKTLGAREHTLTVAAVEDLTPRYRRITFHAPTLFDGQPFPPAAWVRLWAPDPGKPGREHQRGYTLVDPDPDARQVSLEFLLHEPKGPACVWASSATKGDTIQVTRWASGHFQPPELEPDGYLLIGDPAALPGINAILAALPATTRVVVLLQEYEEGDRDLPITNHPRSTVTWVNDLAHAVGDRDWSNWFAWVTAESAATKRVQARLTELGFPRSDVKGRAYWIKGKAMGTDREEAPEAPKEKGQWRSRAGARLLAPLRAKLILAGILQAVVSLVQLAPYLLLVELLRGSVQDRAGLGLLALVLLGAGTALAGVLLLAMHVMDARFGHLVRTTVVRKLARLPLGWFTQRTSGMVKQAVQDDAASVHYLVTHAVLDVVAAIVAPLAVLAYLFSVSAALAAILLAPVLVYLILTARMIAASTAQLAQFTEWETRVGSEAVSYLDGLAVVRAYDAGPAGGFRATLAERARFLDGWQRPLTSRKTLIDLVTRPMTSLLLIVVAGGLLLEPADLLPFLLLGVTFGGQLLAISYGLASVREATAAAQRIGLLLSEPELTEPDPPRTLPSANERTVRFRDVAFSYGQHRVLAIGDLELAPGTVTALVGPSGAGKSTLAALLARFHDVTEGSITIDGTDLRDLPLDELYRAVAFVFQDVSLVDGSVHDNIALSRPDASRHEVEEAARAAQIHERIMRLPAGYDTELGQEGLSGGEAQRITIARALLADRPVLVLDEATAFADPESEHLVQEALGRLVAGRTVLVIAHRLHTVTGADTIVVLDGGHVVQRGTHAELLGGPGLYRDLWQASHLTQETPA